MGLFDRFRKKEPVLDLTLYEEQDYKTVEKAIEDNFGVFPNVLHEIVSEIVHVDIVVIEPNDTKDYYTLMTLGVGARTMNFEPEYNRVEFMIHLPNYWDVKSNDEQWYWPIRLLKTLARFPFLNDTWLGQGHTLEFGDAFFGDLDYYGVILDRGVDIEGNYPRVHLEDGSQVHFVQVIPLFESELNFKLKHSSDALLEYLPKQGYDYIVNPARHRVR